MDLIRKTTFQSDSRYCWDWAITALNSRRFSHHELTFVQFTLLWPWIQILCIISRHDLCKIISPHPWRCLESCKSLCPSVFSLAITFTHSTVSTQLKTAEARRSWLSLKSLQQRTCWRLNFWSPQISRLAAQTHCSWITAHNSMLFRPLKLLSLHDR